MWRMLIITKKTTRAELETEIIRLRTQAQIEAENRESLAQALTQAERDRQNAEHKIATLENDRDNLLGTIRVMADSSRLVRFRKSSMRDADMAMALPMHNTEKL